MKFYESRCDAELYFWADYFVLCTADRHRLYCPVDHEAWKECLQIAWSSADSGVYIVSWRGAVFDGSRIYADSAYVDSVAVDGLRSLPEVVFKLDIPPIMGVMSALVFSVMIGLAATWTKAVTVTKLV